MALSFLFSTQNHYQGNKVIWGYFSEKGTDFLAKIYQNLFIKTLLLLGVSGTLDQKLEKS